MSDYPHRSGTRLRVRPNSVQQLYAPQYRTLETPVPGFLPQATNAASSSSFRAKKNNGDATAIPVRSPDPPTSSKPASLNVHATAFVSQKERDLFERPALIQMRPIEAFRPIASEEVVKHAKLRQQTLPDLKLDLSIWVGKAMWTTMLALEESTREDLWRSYDLTAAVVFNPQQTANFFHELSVRYLYPAQPLPSAWQFVTLIVPGLEEKRPSLTFDDIVLLRPLNNSDEEYEGRVFAFMGTTLVLMVPFAPRFTTGNVRNPPTFRIRFVMDKTLFTLMHWAVNISPPPRYDELPDDMEEILLAREPGNGSELHFFHGNLNDCQKKAVAAIVKRKSVALLPFIVFGGAGSGKTTVVVESVLQLLHDKSSEKRVLVCAPSDAACDVITARLSRIGTKPSDLLRVNSYKRRVEEVQGGADVNRHCNLVRERLFGMPTRAKVQGAKVVVATCHVVGLLIHGMTGLQKGDFTHIIVDESSQATEPETLIPLSLAVKGQTQMVLVGDPFQLGAAILNPDARRRGLDVSLQERLMETPELPFFKQHPDFIVNLVQNYRSNEDLLLVPNMLFYHDPLQCSAPSDLVTSLDAWEGLNRSKPFRLVFHAHKSKRDHVYDENFHQPIFRNIEECNVIVEYIHTMVNTGSLNIRAPEIGVICLFRGQVAQMRMSLRMKGLGMVKVGTVDDVQGQEFKVVFVSTVLSNPSWLEIKMSHPVLGFLSEHIGNTKRFNVALTRAHALCIVVGNPEFLKNFEETWKVVLQVCLERGSCRGDPFTLREATGDDQEGGKHELALDENLRMAQIAFENAFEEVF